MEQRLLEITDLYVEYTTDGVRVRAVNGLNLIINKGETIGLVGETGAGKTTTALSIMRLLPDPVGRIVRGSIAIEGRDITGASEADMQLLRGAVVSMIFQDPMTSLNPVLTIGDQIGEVLQLHEKISSKVRLDEKVNGILRLVGLPPERKNEYPYQFSGGMKQRVIIAIALACEPKILLADEPTTALDVTIQAQVLHMMKTLKDRLGTAMVLITHDLGVVAQTCDRVAIMYAGEIIELGTALQIFEGARRHPYTVGLFDSIPDLAHKSRRLNPIEGLMPDPTALPAGCKFHPRCPKCMPICRTESPVPIEDDGHRVCCHLFRKDSGRERKGKWTNL